MGDCNDFIILVSRHATCSVCADLRGLDVVNCRPNVVLIVFLCVVA